MRRDDLAVGDRVFCLYLGSDREWCTDGPVEVLEVGDDGARLGDPLKIPGLYSRSYSRWVVFGALFDSLGDAIGEQMSRKYG